MNYTVLIPARLASTRLPNKPLADIGGIPMVVRVAQRVSSADAGAQPVRVVVAADDRSITDTCARYGIESVLTRSDHASGSDRLAEACDLLALDDTHIVVNVQGDEPLIEPRLVGAVATLLYEHTDASMSTAAHPISSLEDFLSSNVVKVVIDAHAYALYFSRAPIPLARDDAGSAWWTNPQGPKRPALLAAAPLRHIGIYGYRAGFLRQFPQLPPAPLEQVEALEQLRALWHGHRIAVHLTQQDPGPGVDTPQDLERVRALIQR